MPHRVWRPNIDGISRTVVAMRSPWTYEGKLILDTGIIKTWGTRVAGPDIDFEIEGHLSCLRNNIVGFDLYIDGDKVPHILA